MIFIATYNATHDAILEVINSQSSTTTVRRLTCLELASRLHTTIGWVYDHVESGYLPARFSGRMIRFAPEDVDRWLKSHQHGRALCNDNGPRLLDTRDLCIQLGVSRSWIYEARRSKQLPHYKLDGLLRFSSAQIEDWLEEWTTRSAHEFME